VAKTLKNAQQNKTKTKQEKSPKQTSLFPFLGAERKDDEPGIAYSLVD